METFFSYFLSPLAGHEGSMWIGLAFIILAGAFLTSGFGVGGGVLMTPLTLFILPPKMAIALLAPISLMMSAAGLRQYWGHWNGRHLLILLPSSLAGVWLGSHLLAAIPASVVIKIVGVLAVVFGAVQLLVTDEWRNRLRPATWHGVGFGFGSGISSALAHTGGIVFSLYLLPHSRSKEGFVATTLFLFFSASVMKIGTYAAYGLLTMPLLLLSLTLIPVLLLGAALGKRVNQSVSSRVFLRLVSGMIVLMGVHLLLR